MDMSDILGSLLRHTTSRGGKGGDVLNDIFRRGSQRSSGAPTSSGSSRSTRSSRSTSSSRPTSTSRSTGASRPIDIEREAKELEDLLNVANGHPPTASPRRSPSPPRTHQQSASSVQPRVVEGDQALVVIRAMVNAAKADGRLDQEEQDKILKQLRHPTDEHVQFLRDEFARPLDVREFAMSVPVGMEQQVYTASLIAIDLDTGQEAKYLTELAKNLRIDSETQQQIHERIGAPIMY